MGRGRRFPQLYLTLPAAAAEPSQRLVGFDRIALKAGQSQMARLAIGPATTERPLSFWDTATDDWQIPSGTFGVAVAGLGHRPAPDR